MSSSQRSNITHFLAVVVWKSKPTIVSCQWGFWTNYDPLLFRNSLSLPICLATQLMNPFKPLAGTIIKAFIFPLSTDIPPATSWHGEHQPILLHQSRLRIEEEWKCASGQSLLYPGCPCSFYSALIPRLRQKNPQLRTAAVLGVQGNWRKFYGFSLLMTPVPWTTQEASSEHCWRKLRAHGGQTEGKEIAIWLVW